MIRKILVPLDGSNLSERALYTAIEVLKGNETSTIVALQVLALSEKSHLLESRDFKRAKAEELRLANLYLDSLKEELDLSHTHLETRAVAVHDDIAQTIVDQAKLENVDLIALTSHGRSGLNKLLFGSVAEKVVRLSPVSVLIAR